MFSLQQIYKQKLSKTSGIEKQITAAMMCSVFDESLKEVFGNDILEDASSISFKNGVLKVRVTSSALAQEIQGHWGDLVKKDDLRIIFEIKRN